MLINIRKRQTIQFDNQTFSSFSQFYILIKIGENNLVRPSLEFADKKKVHSKRFSTYLLNFCRQRANPINRTANAILEDWCTSLHQFRIGSKSAVTVCRRASINYVILWKGGTSDRSFTEWKSVIWFTHFLYIIISRMIYPFQSFFSITIMQWIKILFEEDFLFSFHCFFME